MMTVHTLLTENARLREDRRNLREVLERCDEFANWLRSINHRPSDGHLDAIQDKIAEVMEATKD